MGCAWEGCSCCCCGGSVGLGSPGECGWVLHGPAGGGPQLCLPLHLPPDLLRDLVVATQVGWRGARGRGRALWDWGG